MYRCTRCNYIGNEFVQMSKFTVKGCYKCGGELQYIASKPKQGYVSPFVEKKEKDDGL